MAGTEDPGIPCARCGAPNPAGAEACAGCGHGLAGPAPGPPTPGMRPEPAGPARGPESPAVRVLWGVGTFLGRLTAAVAVVAASLLAFVVALFATCSYDTRGDYIFLDLGIGVAAALLVAIGLTVALRMAGGRR